jgi:hypothetical protein
MNMQTGFGESQMAEEYVSSMIDIMLPVMEQSMILAGAYSKACGRNTILPEDMEYAMKYCAMHTVGQHIGSLAPEIYEDEDSDEEDIEEVADEDCPPFVRYTGDDPTFTKVNEAFDRWDSWSPQNPTEQMLKNAINSNEH